MEENVTQINGGITINVDVSVRNFMFVKKIIFESFWNLGIFKNPAKCSCENEKYLTTVTEDSAIMCDEVI